MRDLVELRHFFKRAEEEDLVLCTIVGKTGSSYRALFAKKLISLQKQDSCGLLSGGCLEKEIEEAARECVGQLPFVRSFSTLSEEDRLMGYQKGCAGVIDVLFEKIPRRPDLMDLYLPYGDEVRAAGVRIHLDSKNLGERVFVSKCDMAVDIPETLIEPWATPIALTVVGCGADADPYLELSKALGWSVRFVDYRRDLARQDRFAASDNVKPELVAREKIADSLVEGPRSAVVLMTHNFEADLHIYSGLLNKKFGYLGCVGPRRRYDLLKKDLKNFFDKEPDPDWESRVVNAPPGITSANHSPAEIALSIVADIQLKLGSSSYE